MPVQLVSPSTANDHDAHIRLSTQYFTHFILIANSSQTLNRIPHDKGIHSIS